jgi:hypothetical protein
MKDVKEGILMSKLEFWLINIALILEFFAYIVALID